MALLDLWRSSRAQLEEKRVHQILAFSGSGKLQDGSETSNELRTFLREVPSSVLTRYAGECLADKFDQSGLVLQDLINEVGRRLGFNVEDGRYKGTAGKSGHDGIWSSTIHSIIVEVKTTDAYRINLDNLANYRKLLSESKSIYDSSSILIVVGRQDTGDLEAQIRGSRYGWNIRLISIEALLRLLQLKETVADPAILRKIAGILVPREFTRVDGIIDLVFATAEDIRQDEAPADALDIGAALPVTTKRGQSRVDFYDACVHLVSNTLRTPLIRESRTVYMSPDKTAVALCLLSKVHTSKNTERYWYAFHRGQQEILAQGERAFLALGCGSPDRVLMIPWSEFETWLDGMFTTEDENRFYWHININAQRLLLLRRKGAAKIDLSKYLIAVSSTHQTTKKNGMRRNRQ